MKRYRLSRKADENIITIFVYDPAQFGVQQAAHYHELLEKTFKFLS